jgi:hypothetical protein
MKLEEGFTKHAAVIVVVALAVGVGGPPGPTDGLAVLAGSIFGEGAA